MIRNQHTIIVRFLEPALFVDKETGEAMNTRFIFGQIRKQMPNTPTSLNFDESTEQTGTSLVVATLVSQGLTLFFRAAMKELLGTILALQVIVHLFLMMVPFPGNISNFVSKLKPIASFNILKVVTKYTVKVFNFDVDAQNALRQNIIAPAQDMGIKIHCAVQNLGNVFHLLGYYLISVLILIFSRIQRVYWRTSPAKTEALKKKLFFGQILGVLVAGFIPISIACYYQLQAPLDTTFGEKLGVVAAWPAMLGAFGFLPASLIYILVVDKETLEKPAFKQRWGLLYGNVRINTRSQRAFRHVFLLRRLLILIVGFRLFESPPLQMIAVNLMNISVVLFQGLSEPFKGKFDNRLDLFNEAMVTFITYHLFMFSDVLPDADAQYLIGWSFVAMLSIMLSGNSFFVVKNMIRRLRLLLLRQLRKRIADHHRTEMIQQIMNDTYSGTPLSTSCLSPEVGIDAKQKRTMQRQSTLALLTKEEIRQLFLEQNELSQQQWSLESTPGETPINPQDSPPRPRTYRPSKLQLSIIREETELCESERGEFTKQLYCQLYGISSKVIQRETKK